MTIDPATEMLAREHAMKWLDAAKAAGQDTWRQDELAQFTFLGTRIPLLDRQHGITKPAGFRAALSIRTVFTPAGGRRPYEDAIGPDGLPRYDWRGLDPDLADNVALRRAQELRSTAHLVSGVCARSIRGSVSGVPCC
jgi:putative restriction endonuclease